VLLGTCSSPVEPVAAPEGDGAREGRPKRHPKRRSEGNFVQVIPGKLHDLFVEHGLGLDDRSVVRELIDIVDYVTDETASTLAGLAQHFGLTERRVRESLRRLRVLGIVQYDFPHSGGGWVRLVVYADVVLVSDWSKAERARVRGRASVARLESPTAVESAATSPTESGAQVRPNRTEGPTESAERPEAGPTESGGPTWANAPFREVDADRCAYDAMKDVSAGAPRRSQVGASEASSPRVRARGDSSKIASAVRPAFFGDSVQEREARKAASGGRRQDLCVVDQGQLHPHTDSRLPLPAGLGSKPTIGALRRQREAAERPSSAVLARAGVAPAPGSWPVGPEPPLDDSVDVAWEVLERAPRPSEVEVNMSIAAGPPPEPGDEVDPDEAKEAIEQAIDLLLAAFPGIVVEEMAA